MPIHWNAPPPPSRPIEDSIRVLNPTPIGQYADRSPVYSFGKPFPWVTTTATVLPTKADAWTDGQLWLNDYISKAPLARMGIVLGVAARDGGYVAVVNYYHSNS